MGSAATAEGMPQWERHGYRDKTSWYARLSAYWFASSFKWFVLLTVLLPRQVAALVPEGTKNTAWGFVFALGALWAAIGPSLFGAMSDRRGQRAPYIAAGAALTLVALGLLAVAGSLWEIAAGYLALQIADDLGTGPYSALIPEHVPKDRRGRASGMMSLLSLIGQLAAAVLAFTVASVYATYAAIAAVTVVCAMIAVWTVLPLEARSSRNDRSGLFREFAKGWGVPWRNRNFFAVFLSRLMFSLGLYLIEPYLRNYLTDVVKTFDIFGVPVNGADQATALLAFTITVSAALGTTLGGSVSDRLGRGKVVLVGGGMMGLTLLPFLLTRDYGVLVAIGTVFGLGYGMYLSADWALASDVMPDRDSLGRDMGVWQASDSVVQVFAGSAGRMVDWGNRAALGAGYQLSFGLGAVAFFIGVAAIQRIKGIE